MKRLLLRLSLLTAVIGLGAVAVVETKRALHSDDSPREPHVMARHEEEPRPIPLTVEPDADPTANFEPYARDARGGNLAKYRTTSTAAICRGVAGRRRGGRLRPGNLRSAVSRQY